MIDQQLQFESQSIDPYQVNKRPRKMDILFYDAIVKLRFNLSLGSIFHLLKGVLFIVFIPIDYTVIDGPRDGRILASMIIALIGSIIQFLSLILYRTFPLRDTRMLVNLSGLMGHSTEQPLIGQYNNLKQCVSTTIYNQQNLTLISSQGLTEQLKQKYTSFMSSNLRDMMIKCHSCLNKIDNVGEFVGFIALVYAIVALIIGDYNHAELGVIIAFIVLEGCSKIVVILVLVLIALFPLLCILFCCCICCCYSSQDAQLRLPHAEKATEKMITEGDGTCTICFQNFIVGDNVVVLKCSPKHMFHPLCISGWAKLKATCPICRAPINNQNQQIQNNEHS